MKITTDWKLNIKSKEVEDKVKEAAKKSLKNVVTDIARDSIKGSPWLTGNNAREIMFEVGPGGEVAKESLQGAVYSTSGYGGILETGSRFMSARPYMKPALDRHISKLPAGIKAELR